MIVERLLQYICINTVISEKIMEKTKAIRAEIPEELYNRLRECVKRDYSNVTTTVRSLIVDYVRDNEEISKNDLINRKTNEYF